MMGIEVCSAIVIPALFFSRVAAAKWSFRSSGLGDELQPNNDK